jgi:hypothetical protein
MSSLQAIRDAIKATVEAGNPALFGYDTVPEVANLPAVVAMPDSADFAVAMGRGADTWELDLAVLVPFTDADVSQDALDELVTGAGPKSIRQIIWQNRTLGLADVNAYISGMSDYGAAFEMAQIEHIGAKLRIVVHTSGSA